MSQFKAPSRSEVNEQNQAIFDKLESGLGFVPNIYAFMGQHDNALGSFLAAGERKSTLSKKEQEVVNLVVSQYNSCQYCLSAHTAIAGMNGFSSDQIIEIRDGSISFDSKLAALAEFTNDTVVNRSHASQEAKDKFFAAGYNVQNLIDVVLAISEITVTNYIHGLSKIDIDFPLAPTLEKELSA